MPKNLNDFIHGDRAKVRGTKSNLDKDWLDAKSNKKVNWAPHVSCYEGHKPMPLPGTSLVIHGGSCSSPTIKDADVYIHLQKGDLDPRHWPWKKGVGIMFPITDMSIPAEPAEFRKMVAWTKKALEEGKKVHCGCIGGHGRTGMFFAALVSEFGEKDAITYVRKNYCHKAVESSSQIKFLNKEYGITEVKGSKEGKSYGVTGSSYGHKTEKRTYNPLLEAKTIWGPEPGL